MPTNKRNQKKRDAIWTQLWTDPKYIRLTERAEKLSKLWNQADAWKNQPGGDPVKAERLSALLKKAHRRVQEYEDAAFLKAGLLL